MNRLKLLPLLALAATVACDESPAEPIDAPDESVLVTFFAPATAFGNGTYPCPEGGTQSVQREASFTEQDDVRTIVWSRVHVHNACAIALPGGERLTTDGTLSEQGVERQRILDNALPVVLERTIQQSGRLRWRTAESDVTCDLEVTLTLDPETKETELRGSICGHEVEFRIPALRP